MGAIHGLSSQTPNGTIQTLCIYIGDQSLGLMRAFRASPLLRSRGPCLLASSTYLHGTIRSKCRMPIANRPSAVPRRQRDLGKRAFSARAAAMDDAEAVDDSLDRIEQEYKDDTPSFADLGVDRLFLVRAAAVLQSSDCMQTPHRGLQSTPFQPFEQTPAHELPYEVCVRRHTHDQLSSAPLPPFEVPIHSWLQRPCATFLSPPTARPRISRYRAAFTNPGGSHPDHPGGRQLCGAELHRLWQGASCDRLGIIIVVIVVSSSSCTSTSTSSTGSSASSSTNKSRTNSTSSSSSSNICHGITARLRSC